ncbi:MAG: hypothetical protein CMO01_05460 [Thalassobius sp.]|nr:hypothetical protein [Thalassovita sp.]
MSYDQLMYVHLVTVVPCIFIGAFLLFSKKGQAIHRNWGKVYMALMIFTAFVSLWMPARVGGNILGHFGWIHVFSLLTIYTVPTAILAIKKGDVKSHKRKMIILYVGAIVIAGGFTLAPGRYLHEVFFN